MKLVVAVALLVGCGGKTDKVEKQQHTADHAEARTESRRADSPEPTTTRLEKKIDAIQGQLDDISRAKLDADRLEVNKAYDRQEFERAREMALAVLVRAPGDVRMLRLIVSASCMVGDAVSAQKYVADLPDQDRAQMKTRCARVGINLTD